MRTLTHLDEFRREAQNALFTKQQAISVTLRLLELDRPDARRMRCRPYYRAGYHRSHQCPSF